VLHTWSQNLLPHPHVHCVVPAGGLSPLASRGNLSPTGITSARFRGVISHMGGTVTERTPGGDARWSTKALR
jgi:hypothetical protein